MIKQKGIAEIRKSLLIHLIFKVIVYRKGAYLVIDRYGGDEQYIGETITFYTALYHGGMVEDTRSDEEWAKKLLLAKEFKKRVKL